MGDALGGLVADQVVVARGAADDGAQADDGVIAADCAIFCAASGASKAPGTQAMSTSCSRTLWRKRPSMAPPISLDVMNSLKREATMPTLMFSDTSFPSNTVMMILSQTLVSLVELYRR